MHLTQQTEFALRLLMYLAAHPDELPTVAVVSESFRISENHLATITTRLVNSGLVEAKRGRGGGLRLARPAAEISVGAVVRDIESLRLVECFDPERSQCPVIDVCRLAGALAKAQEAFLVSLDDVMVSDLVKNRSQLVRALVRRPSD